MGVKIAAVHNVAAIASGIVRAGADYVAIDGFTGGTGAAPQIIRDNVGIPIELAIAVVDKRLREEGIRNQASIIAAGSIRSRADMVKAIALGADAVDIGTARSWPWAAISARGATPASAAGGSPPEARSDPPRRSRVRRRAAHNLVHAWSHEIQEILGALGVNAVEWLRGNRERLRAVGLDEQTCENLGVKPAGM